MFRTLSVEQATSRAALKSCVPSPLQGTPIHRSTTLKVALEDELAWADFCNRFGELREALRAQGRLGDPISSISSKASLSPL